MSQGKRPLGKRDIDTIMSEFDFQKVHAAMVATNWTWVDSLGVPSIAEMRVCARELLEACVVDGKGFQGTGGFIAEVTKDGLSLYFELESVTLGAE